MPFILDNICLFNNSHVHTKYMRTKTVCVIFHSSQKHDTLLCFFHCICVLFHRLVVMVTVDVCINGTYIHCRIRTSVNLQFMQPLLY